MEKEDKIDQRDERGQEKPKGYTLVELLGVTAIMIFAVLATQGMIKNYKKFAFEETAVQRLKQISQAEHIYRHSGDLTINPEGTYGTFFELQNAGLLPGIYADSDERRHTVNAFVPHYRLDFMRSEEDSDLDPDGFRYLVMAVPLTNYLGLKTFYMQEDGEVYWQRYLWLKSR